MSVGWLFNFLVLFVLRHFVEMLLYVRVAITLSRGK